MKTNTAVKRSPIYTHEGAKAEHITPLQQLERSVLACLLWEDSFYEDGESVADRIMALVPKVAAKDVAELAIKARGEFRLRHVPLLLTVAMAKAGYKNTEATLVEVIQRADELTELLSLYWLVNGKDRPVAAQIKRALAKAFGKFDAYQLAKYDRKGAVNLRDVLRLVHPKPKDDAQSAMWKALMDGTLPSPDTWEVALSAGGDKKEVFTRLLMEKKLGYMALLRNLRNMSEAKVDDDLVRRAILIGAPYSKALPFRFLSALRAAPMFAPELDGAMQAAMLDMPRLEGRTVIAVDVSGSMSSHVAGKSQITRQDAAAAVAILVRGICANVRIIGFGTEAEEVPAFSGMAIAEYLRPLGQRLGYGTEIGKAVSLANELGYDRLVVITDEQSHDRLVQPMAKAYMVNVAHYQNGIGYHAPWKHINGFSEGVVRYIQETEKAGL